MNSYWPGTLPEPSVRTLNDMRCVLANLDHRAGAKTLTYPDFNSSVIIPYRLNGKMTNTHIRRHTMTRIEGIRADTHFKDTEFLSRIQDRGCINPSDPAWCEGESHG